MIYNESKTLNNGVEIPVLGLGVYNSGDETAKQSKLPLTLVTDILILLNFILMKQMLQKELNIAVLTVKKFL